MKESLFLGCHEGGRRRHRDRSPLTRLLIESADIFLVSKVIAFAKTWSAWILWARVVLLLLNSMHRASRRWPRALPLSCSQRRSRLSGSLLSLRPARRAGRAAAAVMIVEILEKKKKEQNALGLRSSRTGNSSHKEGLACVAKTGRQAAGQYPGSCRAHAAGSRGRHYC